MKKNLLIIYVVCTQLYAQKTKNDPLDFQPDIAISIISNYYFGDNYLSKGHQNPSIGIQLKSEFLHYNKFNLGISLEKSTQKVTDFSIGGVISKTNSSSVVGYLSYDIYKKSKIKLSPEFNMGQIELKQKSGKKKYGTQNGMQYGIGLNINYLKNKKMSYYSNLSYNRYLFNVATSSEFTDYFNHSNSFSLSFGIKLY
jgi:hypothetical protein